MSINPRRLSRILWFIAKRVSHPGRPILRTLEFNFVSPARHDREKSVSIGDAKRLKRHYRRSRQRQRVDHPDQFRHRDIRNPDKYKADQRSFGDLKVMAEAR